MQKLCSQLSFLLFLITLTGLPKAVAQNGQLKGILIDGVEETPVLFAVILVTGLGTGVTTDLEGNFNLELPAGTYQLEISCVGYQAKNIEQVEVQANQVSKLNIILQPAVEMLKEVEVQVSPMSKKEKSPLSLRKLNTKELQYMAGASMDVSKAISVMPGVTKAPGFNNALSVRGGSDSENKFFLDDIEIPILNHYSRQGSSGGAVSILNPVFTNRVHLYSSAFPTNKGNMVSGLLDFSFKDPNKKEKNYHLNISTTDATLSFDGPVSKKIGLLASFKQSYVGPILRLINQPYIINFRSWNIKTDWEINPFHKITFLGIGANDRQDLNMEAEKTPYNLYFLNATRPSNVWHALNALKYTNYRGQHFTHVILSHFHYQDEAWKYLHNDETRPEGLLESFHSQEGEARLTVKNVQRYNSLKVAFGGEIGKVFFNKNTRMQLLREVPDGTYSAEAHFNYIKYGAYGQVSKRLFNKAMLLTVGARVDANNYSASMSNPLDQLSPRLSVAYAVNQKTTINFNTGIYYQMPANVTLGFEDLAGDLANKYTDIKYLKARHIVLGTEWENLNTNTKINLEGYYRKYDQYPFSMEEGVALVNQNREFAIKGEELVTSTGGGRSYGMEVMLQQKEINGFYGLISYTLGWSEFKDHNGVYRPALTDIRHVLNINAGKHFTSGWHIGINWQFQTPQPYTPFNMALSSHSSVWDNTLGLGVYDYTQLNTQRIDPINTLDVRVDKKLNLRAMDLWVYIDIINVLNAKPALSPLFATEKDTLDQPVSDPESPGSYKTFMLKNNPKTFLPAFGFKISW